MPLVLKPEMAFPGNRFLRFLLESPPPSLTCCLELPLAVRRAVEYRDALRDAVRH